MVDASDAIGLAETGIGLGASLLFVGMALNFTKDMTDKMIDQGKKQGKPRKRTSKKRKPDYNPFNTKNLNKPFGYY